MALILNTAYLQSSDGKSIFAYDLTGTTPPSGYGGTNANVGDFTTCVFDIYPPDPSSGLPSSTLLVTINAWSTLPSANPAISFELTSLAMFSETKVLPNGMMRIVRRQLDTTDDPPFEYSDDDTIPIIHQVDCCIQNKILLFPLDDCCNDCNKKLLKLLKADLMLDQVRAVSRETGGLSPVELCNLLNKGAKIIQFAESICNSDCAPCASCSSC